MSSLVSERVWTNERFMWNKHKKFRNNKDSRLLNTYFDRWISWVTPHAPCIFTALFSCLNISSRWFGIPGHAPPPTTAHQEPQQRDSSSPEDQHHGALGAWGPLHPVLLHALPTDGMGEPQRRALQGHFTDGKVSLTVTLEMMLLSHCCFSPDPG